MDQSINKDNKRDEIVGAVDSILGCKEKEGPLEA